MERTVSWIQENFPRLGSDYIVTSTPTDRWGVRYGIQMAMVSDCQLRLQMTQERDQTPAVRRDIFIPLQDIDADSLPVREYGGSSGMTNSKPSYAVWMVANQARGKPFRIVGDMGGSGTETDRIALRVRELELGYRARNAIRNASVLCGASTTLSGTMHGPFIPGRYTREGKIADYIDFNPDGVFFLSIQGRIATGRFTVKENTIAITSSGDQSDELFFYGSRVYDSDFMMWERVADSGGGEAAKAPEVGVQTNPGSAALTRSRAEDSCRGIENLGLVKNTLQMETGLVEWVARIRNNGAELKVVTVGWRDLYGKLKRLEFDVPGGGSASPRLEVTGPRVIPPVADLRVLACQ